VGGYVWREGGGLLTDQLLMPRHSLMLRMASLGSPVVVMVRRLVHPVTSSLSSLSKPVRFIWVSEMLLQGERVGCRAQ